MPDDVGQAWDDGFNYGFELGYLRGLWDAGYTSEDAQEMLDELLWREEVDMRADQIITDAAMPDMPDAAARRADDAQIRKMWIWRLWRIINAQCGAA